VLLDLAQKGMPALAKLQMLQMMDLPAALQRITVPTAEDEETAALALAQLVAGVGMVLLECWKHVGQEQGFASEAAVAAAAQLHRIMPLAWSLIGHELCSVGLAALELAQAAVSSMRESWAAEAAAAAAAAGRTFWLAEQLPLLLDMVLRRVRYPPSYAFGAAQPSEEMEEFDQLRERLRHLFSRLAVLSGERVLTFLAAVFSSALPAASLGALPFHDVEAALTLLGALAEKGVDVG
ncbi:hypothetical protein, partial [Brevundimonas sp.]|uniref:hypothetical protein n=1 Tax=Brevundimonas sp. TaxID=1871086 RepID=UPI00391AD9C5